jgi:DNA/RNA endonuclease YhcR with UshA esterase domain
MKTLALILSAAILALGALNASAAEQAALKTVAALYKEKASLAGKLVRVEGKVVKVNNNIMGRNFLHVQDGTGAKDSNDVTITSKDTAVIGDRISVVGRVTVDKDFGAGYAYPILLEEASIAKK